MANGNRPLRFGPFDSYDQAKAAWQAQSWANVDSCHHRFTIVKDEAPQNGDKTAA